MLIGLCGKKQSGKSTVAKHLNSIGFIVTHHYYEHYPINHSTRPLDNISKRFIVATKVNN